MEDKELTAEYISQIYLGEPLSVFIAREYPEYLEQNPEPVDNNKLFNGISHIKDNLYLSRKNRTFEKKPK